VPTRTAIDDFLGQRNLAFAGASRNSREFANSVYRHLRDGGRTMYPVHRDPDVLAIEGDVAFHSVAEVPDPVDGIVVMVPPDSVVDVVSDAIDRGIQRVWLYRGSGQGSVVTEAVRLCQQAGVSVVDGACPFMFDGRPTGFHRVHAFFSAHRIAS